MLERLSLWGRLVNLYSPDNEHASASKPDHSLNGLLGKHHENHDDCPRLCRACHHRFRLRSEHGSGTRSHYRRPDRSMGSAGWTNCRAEDPRGGLSGTREGRTRWPTRLPEPHVVLASLSMKRQLPLAVTRWRSLFVNDVVGAGTAVSCLPSRGARPNALQCERWTNRFEFTGACAKVMTWVR